MSIDALQMVSKPRRGFDRDRNAATWQAPHTRSGSRALLSDSDRITRTTSGPSCPQSRLSRSTPVGHQNELSIGRRAPFRKVEYEASRLCRTDQFLCHGGAHCRWMRGPTGRRHQCAILHAGVSSRPIDVQNCPIGRFFFDADGTGSSEGSQPLERRREGSDVHVEPVARGVFQQHSL